jgi:hypothetical protein
MGRTKQMERGLLYASIYWRTVALRKRLRKAHSRGKTTAGDTAYVSEFPRAGEQILRSACPPRRRSRDAGDRRVWRDDGERAAVFARVLNYGTHRAIAALRAGKEFKAYCLGARETAYCLMETEAWMAKGKVIAHDAVDFAFR